MITTTSTVKNEQEESNSVEVEQHDNSNITIWDIILRQDYLVQRDEDDDKTKAAASPCRRHSQRLQQQVASAYQRVQQAHTRQRTNTEAAFFHVSEMVQHHQGRVLSKARLRQVLQRHAPLRINQVCTTGGVLLVEVCRARDVTEAVILHCIQELVQGHGADVNSQTYESATAYETALCVAATRGLPAVVQYLLAWGAKPGVRCAGRFRSQLGQLLSRRNVTALEFATAMYQLEQGGGTHVCSNNDHHGNALSSRDLANCIQLLQNCETTVSPSLTCKQHSKTRKRKESHPGNDCTTNNNKKQPTKRG